ncbi:MAG: hypothetical protein BIFFINMI_03964 [Phycisphaerae bacterium]|nr:hypothetical protein [Phycisphaerae bacterium]
MSDWLSDLKNPPAAFRGSPFWAWNSKLDRKELVRQVGELARGGFGGGFLHVRYGLETEYMSEEYLDCVKAVVEEMKRRKMEAWLYDEDRWPSGFAGGEVTRDHAHRLKGLILETVEAAKFTEAPSDAVRCFTAQIDGDRACDVQPLRAGATPPAGSTVLVYRAMTSPDTPWFNNQAYLDTMSPQAVRAFIDSTHEPYKRAVGKHFGKTIPGIFTDEPNFGHFGRWGSGGTRRAVPWTSRLTVEFRSRFGYDVLDHLPQLHFEVEGVDIPVARHDYRRLTAELYTEAFSKQLGDWCAANKLELTGHELSEESLFGQIDQVGACMPHYEHFQRPGIDILKDAPPELLTAKQCVSVASQLGRNRVLSELYGCTGWETTFEDYKHIGDWHQVLGVNSFCPHLSWYSMAGGAKRDYPASIFYQSPWWGDHKLLADYFARLSLALSRGQAVREVLVVHPIESAWLVHRKESRGRTESLSESLYNVCELLMNSQVDFDFGDESLMARYAKVGGDKNAPRLTVGQMAYRAVVVPESITLRASTVALLEAFVAAGGQVVFVGQSPSLIDCRPDGDGRLSSLIARSDRSEVSPAGLVAALGEGCRPVCVNPVQVVIRPQHVWTHLRRVDDGEVLMLHHRDRVRRQFASVRWAGTGRIREIDLLTGRLRDLPGVESSGGAQEFILELGPSDARLLYRTAGDAASPAVRPQPVVVERINLAPTWACKLDEPNGITLDYCRMKVHGATGGWSERRLLWQHERDLRAGLGFRDNAIAADQPYIWMRNLSPAAADVELEFEVDVETQPTGVVSLVLEHPDRFAIAVNGKSVPSKDAGWFIDRSFRVVPLSGVKWTRGTNVVTLRTRYREHHFLEECYLTGRFGSRTSGDRVVMTALPKKLSTGDWTGQGLAMYSGAVTYSQTVRAPMLGRGQRVVLNIDRPAATCIRVAVNGKKVKTLGWAPWRVDLTRALRAGQGNKVEITVVSSRRNLLGPLHHGADRLAWTGPSQFRSEAGKSMRFRGDYNLVPYGLTGEVYLTIER